MISDKVFEYSLEVREYLINASQAIDCADLPHRLVLGDNWHGLVAEGSKALLKCLDVIIIAPGGLGSLEDALDHGFLIGVDEEDKGHVH